MVIAKTKPPKLRSPRKYSSKKFFDEATYLLAQNPITKITIKNTIRGISASQFMCHPSFLPHKKRLQKKKIKNLPRQKWTSQQTIKHNNKKTMQPTQRGMYTLMDHDG